MKPLNARQEQFCQNLVSGMSATQAYISAGFSARGANSAASKLKSLPHVAARLGALRSGLAQVADLSRQEVLTNLAAAYTLAMNEQMIGHAISAMDKYSKICGYDISPKAEGHARHGEQVVVTFDADASTNPNSPAQVGAGALEAPSI